MTKHALRGLAVILALVFLMVLTAVPVLAFDARAEDTITIASG